MRLTDHDQLNTAQMIVGLRINYFINYIAFFSLFQFDDEMKIAQIAIAFLFLSFTNYTIYNNLTLVRLLR